MDKPRTFSVKRRNAVIAVLATSASALGVSALRSAEAAGPVVATPRIGTFASGISTVAPRVTSIVRLDSNPHSFGTVRWRVTFSQPVTNVGVANFTLSSTGLGALPSLISVSPTSGPTSGFTVSANTGPITANANPTLRLNLSAIGSIRNTAGRLLAAPYIGESYTLDGVAPTVAFTRANGSPATFPVTSSRPINSVGGTCGDARGDGESVNIAITGSTTRTTVVECESGRWTLRVGFSAGRYTLTATQVDNAGNAGSSGPKTIVIGSTDAVAPTVTLTLVNGASSTNGSPIAFPLTTNQQIDTIGGSCGTDPGDIATVTVAITGPNARTGTAPCASGTWAFDVSPALLNSPVGVNDGDYTIVVTQPDTANNLGTTGPKTLTIATRTFTVTGNARTALQPGTTSELTVTVNNPYPFALKIETLSVTFTGSGTCDGPTNFSVSRPFAGPIVVPPGSTVIPDAVAPQIKMLNLDVPQDACKSASISLNYSGLASRA